MKFAENMKAKAVQLQKKLVLPEGTEPRTVAAARRIVDERLAAKVTLIGKPDMVEKTAKEAKVSLEGITVVDPAASDLRKQFANEYFQLRKHKGMTEEEAFDLIANELRFGAMMVRLGIADAMVAGAAEYYRECVVGIIPDHKDKTWNKKCFLMFRHGYG